MRNVNISMICNLEGCEKPTKNALNAYCCMNHMARAKRRRRKMRENGEESEAPRTQRLEYPESDEDSLDAMARVILDGGPWPVFFPKAEENAWIPPSGIKFWITPDGFGRMERSSASQ